MNDLASCFRISASCHINITLIRIKYKKKKKKLQLRHLSTDCHALLRKAGQLVVDSDDDPSYGVAVDYAVKPGVFGQSH